MRYRLSLLAIWALVLADTVLLVLVFGLGKDGWRRFALDVVIVALGVNINWNWWMARRKARA